MRWPIDRPAFGRPFGWRNHPVTGKRQFHLGQDFPNSSGTPLHAIGDGVVYTAATVRQNPGGGNFIGIRFGDGSRCRYFHMRDAPALRVGDTVREGDIVGYLGNTGTWTTGPHLHFEISDHKGVAQDPRVFIQTRLTEQVSASGGPSPEEDDMYSNDDRKRDDIAAWNVGQTKSTADAILAEAKKATATLNRIETNVALSKWALTDGTVGLRQLVGALISSVAALQAGAGEGTLSEEQLDELAQKFASTSLAGVSAEIAKNLEGQRAEDARAVADELARRLAGDAL